MHWRGAVHDGTRWLLDPSRTSHNYCELCVLELVFTCFQPFDLGQCHHQQVGSGLVKVCYLKFYFSLTLYLVGIQCMGFKCSTTSRVLIGLGAAFVGSATEELPLPKRVFSVSLKRGIFTRSYGTKYFQKWATLQLQSLQKQPSGHQQPVRLCYT